MKKNPIVDVLLKKGVDIAAPGSIEVGQDVNPDLISGEGVVIHAGCKLFGTNTLICRGAVLGHEAPVTVENCQIGPEVTLKGGYLKDAVFLKKASMGSGAHVREGSILEEEASGAHTVGLKQTILFPYVTLGSLINFCDCLMSGGTGPKDHSEVGSSYIHFNFTPNQDKATASLIGNVPQGVMLNQSPIFLGGQGGLVGPSRLAFGTVIAAGSIYRKDELRPGRLIIEGGGRGGNLPVAAGYYRSIKRIFNNNINYIANLMALRAWYDVVRRAFISTDFPVGLFEGGMEKVALGIDERLKRLKAFSLKLPESARIYKKLAGDKASASLLAQKKALHERWDDVEAVFDKNSIKDPDRRLREEFLEIITKKMENHDRDYLLTIKAFSAEEAAMGSLWLKGIVDNYIRETFQILTVLSN